MKKGGLPPLPPRFRGTLARNPDALAAAAGSRGPVWMSPTAVLTPCDTESVALGVTWAAENGLALVPRGAATGMPGGNVGTGVVLDLTGLAAPCRLDPSSHTLEGGAGTVAAEADAVARRTGRHLAALPSSAPWCTLGGMAACDAAGARSFRHGPMHAQVAALEVVRTDGVVEWLTTAAGPDPTPGPWQDLYRTLSADAATLLDGWPAVRKNASGYALDRFFATADATQLVVGSEGTLAIITRVRMATEPLPEAEAVCLIGLPDLDALAPLAESAGEWGASACEFFGHLLLEFADEALPSEVRSLGTEAGAVLLEFQGTTEHVAAGLAAARRGCRGLGGVLVGRGPEQSAQLWSVRHAASPTIARAADAGRRSLQFMEDSIVPPRAVGSYLRGVEEILERHDTPGVVFGHAGDGNLHVNPLVDMTEKDWKVRVRHMLEETVALVVDLDGTLAGEHGDGRVRAPYLEAVWGHARTAAFRDVKSTLDPEGILNPGVVLPLEGQDPLEGLGAGPADRRLGDVR